MTGKYSEETVFERRFWLRITRNCNNHCIFCHDSDNQTGGFIPLRELEKEISGALAGNFSRLIISGGEASIHPDFFQLIRYARMRGFKKIQTITNGRMFAYASFAAEAVDAGLDEATFSIHGHTPELHDRITGVPNSFGQAVQGLVNLLRTGHCIVNIDIVVNRLNFKYIGDIVHFFSALGVFEYDLLDLVPFGKAYENRRMLFYDHQEALPYLRPVFELGMTDRYYIWTNRFPANILEGFEQLIQDPHKLYDEIQGRGAMFQKFRATGKMDCRSDRCDMCTLADYCLKFFQYYAILNGHAPCTILKTRTIDQHVLDMLGNITRLVIVYPGRKTLQSLAALPGIPHDASFLVHDLDALTVLLERFPRPVAVELESLSGIATPAHLLPAVTHCTIHLHADNIPVLDAWRSSGALPSPDSLTFKIPAYERLSDAEKGYAGLAGFLVGLGNEYTILDCAPCIHPGGISCATESFNTDALSPNNSIDPDKLMAIHIREDYHVKSYRCRSCIMNESCRGMHINYIRKMGFAVLQPIHEE